MVISNWRQSLHRASKITLAQESKAMKKTVDESRRGDLIEESDLYTARVQVVKAMEQGILWREAVQLAGLAISQSTAYRLRQLHLHVL